MKKIEASSLEAAYEEASRHFGCSVTELDIVVVQQPKKGFFGFMSQQAVIVAKPKMAETPPTAREERSAVESVPEGEAPVTEPEPAFEPEVEEDLYEDDDGYYEEEPQDLESVAEEVKKKINALFDTLCFELEAIEVRPYDDNTLLVEFNGEDAALLIGKEGYRYKALSYMIFNWINAEYQLQLRLEIAEFLQNQEESIARYLTGVCESVDRDGRAQTRVLDGVLVQIALKQLRERYHDKYVAIRTTRDGGKYIIINDYHHYCFQ